MSAARDKVIGSTIRNTAEMHPMGTGKQPISSADVAPVAPVVPVVRVALVVPENPAVPELETGPVATLELVINPVVAGPGLVPAVEALAPNHQRVPLVVLRKTKSVTALHRHDLAAVLMAGDLAVAETETMRERAATEAVTAWEAAE